MYQASHGQTEIAVPLSPPEQWIVYGLLRERLQRTWQRGAGPPEAMVSTFEKIEDGTHVFTPGELRVIRTELNRAMSEKHSLRVDRNGIYRIRDRISRALARHTAEIW